MWRVCSWLSRPPTTLRATWRSALAALVLTQRQMRWGSSLLEEQVSPWKAFAGAVERAYQVYQYVKKLHSSFLFLVRVP